MLTGVTLCSGGGLAALGLQAAGVRLVGAVEYDPAIAAVYRANLGDHMTVAPVQEVDYRPWAGVDVLQVSPPCLSFSVAKSGGQETALDTAIAAAIVRALTTIRPRYFWLENVEGYTGSTSYRAIRAALDSLDYWSHATVVNSADYGVPQTRRRLILRAVAGGWMQPFRPLPVAMPWVGWYAAIADLRPTLPESAFAPWQLARLPAELTQALVVDCQNSDTQRPMTVRTGQEPMYTLTAGMGTRPVRAFLMNTSADKWGDGLRTAAEPAATIRTGQQHLPRAFIVDGANASRSITIRQQDDPMFSVMSNPRNSLLPRAWLSQGRVVKMTPRALARFQSVPDSYQLPAGNALACRVIGNGVPVLVAQAVTASLVSVNAAQAA